MKFEEMGERRRKPSALDSRGEVPALDEETTGERVNALTAMLDCVSEIVWYKDTANNILWANRAALRASGVTMEQVVGKSCEALSPREAATYRETDEMIVESQRPVLGVQQTLREVTGRRIPVVTDKYPRFDSDGKVIGIISVCRDTTTQSRVAEALLASERPYQRLTENSPLAVGKMSVDGRVEWVNERWCELTGLGTEQSAEQGWLDAVHPEDREALRYDWHDVISRRQPTFRARFRLGRAPTEIHHVVMQAVAETDEAGRLYGYTATLADVSTEESGEAALREQHQIVDALAAAAPIGIFYMDPDGNVAYVNKQWREIWRFDSGETMGLAWTDAVHTGDKERVLATITAATENKHRGRVEFRVNLANGTLRWLLGRISPQLGAQGEVVGHFGTVSDITERVEAERAVKELNEQLEQKVAERTAELHSANEELEAFCYSISHDLRIPLRILDGFSYTLIEDHTGGLNEAAVESLHRIRAASQRMGQLIDDLLTMSRINRGAVKREEVDLSAMASAVVDEFRLAEPQRRVHVEIVDGAHAMCDPSLTRVVLQNLIGNAWKFTSKQEEANLEFGLQESANGSGPVYFVRDDGVGFNMIYEDKLFNPFERLHDDEEFAGSGIGLATVKRIVKRHGGHVWAESDEGEGATLYFSLRN